MNSKKRLWAVWALGFAVTLLPVFAVLWMFLIGDGFDLTVWLATLVIAAAGFAGAQLAVSKMRSVSDDDKLGTWMLRSEARDRRLRERESKETEREQGDFFRDDPEEAIAKYSKPQFWKGLEGPRLRREVGKLFLLSGRRVRRVAAHRSFDQGLLLDFNTYVVFASDGKRSTPQDAVEAVGIVAANPSYASAMLVSPQGFPRSARAFAAKKSLILLDADNLARFARSRERHLD
jgi:hypothetical protein